jgi:hypothetical protein
MANKITPHFIYECLVACVLLLASLAAGAGVQTHSEIVTEDITWLASDVHRVSGVVTVNPGVSLSIEAGTVVKFDQLSQLIIAGSLIANGTQNNKIIFTSYRDDSVGGNTNGDAADESGVAGDWLNLQFNASANENLTSISHVIVRYAGGQNHAAVILDGTKINLSECSINHNAYNGLAVFSDTAEIEQCQITHNAGDGVHIVGSNVSLLNNTITDNVKNGVYLLAYSGTPSLDGNVIQNNDWGLYYDSYNGSEQAIIKNNTITNNNRPLYIPAQAVPDNADNNILGPNTQNAIWLAGSEHEINHNIHFQVVDFGAGQTLNSYYLHRSKIMMASGTTLTVDPNVIIKFNSQTSLNINGQLFAVGTSNKPVVFTSVHDDNYGGDFNLDNFDTMPQNGDWRGIQLGAQSTGNVLEHAVILYAGGDSNANIYAYHTDLAIRDSVIANSADRGIHSEGSTTTITDSEIFANSAQGVYAQQSGQVNITGGRVYANFDGGIYYADDVAGQLENVQIFANLAAGLQNTGSQNIDARGNWWGAKNGPSGDESGSGALVRNMGSGSILVSDIDKGILLDGTRFNLFDAGGSRFDNYGIAIPVATGTPSNEWGTRPEYTQLENPSKQISLEYTGLEEGTSYDVLLTYLSKDDDGTRQRLDDGNAQQIHPAIQLPNVFPTSYRYNVPQESIVNGALKLDIHAEQGPRALLSMAVLLKKGVNDITPVVITVNQPQNNLITTQASQVITGVLDDIASLTINGEVVNVKADLSFSHNITLSEGEHIITITATDSANNVSSKLLNLILDTSAPVITVEHNVFTNNNAYALTGSLNESASLTVNGEAVTIENDLSFSKILFLNQGENTVTISATDEVGNSVTETRTITLDTSVPLITLTSLMDGLLTNNVNQIITGNVSELSSLTINGEAAIIANDLSFSHTVSLIEGENIITVIATDAANNNVTQTITITLDLSAPAITVISPADGLLTTQAAQIITGNLAALGTLTINDIDVTVETDLSFSHAITLTEGENTITLIATDELSNTITQSLNLELDTTAPVITVSSPEDGGFLTQNITAITGSLNEVATLTINGESVTIDAVLNFTHDISLNEGENTFTLVATDDAGHSTSQPLTVTLDDAVAPTITITNPQDGLVTSQAVHNIIGSLDEAGSVTINGSGITVNNDLSFSHEITLVDGENVYTVVASDAATNTSTVLLNITLDNALPTTPVVTSHAISPTENLLAQKLVTITGTREANTSIWIDGTEQVALGSDDWTATLTLNEGNSLLSIIAKDAAQNSSAEVTVQFKIDTIVPVISNVTPAAILNTIPNVIQVNFTEAGSGLDNANTQLAIVRNAVIVDGSLAINADNLVFTPTQALQEGVYTIRPQLVDIAGNNAAVNDYTFTLDFTAPSTPVLSAYSATTNINVVNFNGTKDAGTAIALNGVEIVAENGNTTWSHQASLVAGSNVIDFTAIDSAGNDSAVATATVTFDDAAPGAISLLASVNGSGTEINLDWAAYDEFTNGNDIAEYRVYSLTTDFTDTASANLISTVAAGTKTATASNLTRQQTVFFAVVAVDVQGNVLTNVTAVSATPADTTAPSNVADFNANSFADNLQLSWTSLSATVNDLAGYKLYIDGAATGIDLGSAITTHDLNGLAAATGYTLRLTAVDNDGNENEGVTINAATLLSNPAITSTESLDGLVSLTWGHSQPHALVAGYNIYAETSDFGTSIEGLTAKTTVAANKLQASAFNLNNETQYWLAVSAVNISGGETKLVTTTIAVPTPDSQGPEITSILFDGQALIADQTITASGQIAVTATDRTGISRIELLIDGSVIGSESNASSGSYSLPLDILATSDGAHSLMLRAVDTLGNESDQVISVNVALAPPSAPTLSQPVADTGTNQQQLTVSGQADLYTQVKIYNNGSVVGTPITVNEQGIFSLNINLVEGANAITATAEHSGRGGDSASSASRTITLDQSVPDAPSGFTATSRILGEVRLSWNSVADPRVQGYNVYRSNTPFESSSELGVEKLNTLFITDEGYTDLPANNGVYYYRVTSANELGSQSTSSQQVSAESDSLGPRALSIVYIPDGNTDIDSGRVAPGLVDVEITFDEALRNVPYFALTPDGGIPIVINMIKDRSDGRIYKGNFVLQNSTPSGAAFAILTAHDEYGNRGTEIDSGGSILIDTSGPDVLELTLNPTNPIQVDPQLAVSARTIDISVRLNEAVADGFQPRLIPQLDGVVLQGYGDGISLSRDAGSPEAAPVWTGQFILPASAGQNTDGSDGVQVLSFSHSAFDDLDNESTKIQGLNQFQVYQGDLPPVGIPFRITAKAVADGNVELNWQSVEEASGYKLYRQAFNETQMTELTVLAGADTLTYTDIGLADGVYQYAIASTRSANSQLSESGLSEPVTVIADGTKPNTPQNLQLELNGAGTVLRWLAPTGELDLSKIKYNLYRLPIVEGETVDLEGVEPLQTNIPNLADLIALDKQPDRNARTYVITAVDAAGNESIESNAVTQAIVLLPVSNLAISLQEEAYPHLTWTHTDNTVQGYDVYIDSINADNKLNTIGMVTDTFFTDTSYNNGSPSNGADLKRHYIVVAIDDQATRSIGHSLVLPALNVALNNAGSQQLDRGIMNNVVFRVDNKGDAATQNQRLLVTIDDDGTSRQHQSNSFSIDAGSFTLVSVVVGGYNSLNTLGELQLQLSQTPQAGEHVTIAQSDSIVVGDNALSISLTTEEFTRGATGKVRFTLDNNSGVETELLLAKSNGNQASPEIRLIIEDLDGNTLSTQAIKQFGGGAITTTNGNTVARIAAGASFTSELIEIAIPGGSPDQIQLRLEIDHYHYHLDRSDHVQIKGSEIRKNVDLIDTQYYAQITNISDSVVYGTQPITITGQSIDRTTGQPLAGVDVKLVFSVSGFERSTTLPTDSKGQFTYIYTPANNESGRYQVSAIHPDVIDRPNHGEFIIQIVNLSPQQINLNIPKNYDQTLNIRVTAGKETSLSNLRLEYVAEDQINGIKPEGISLSSRAGINVTANSTAYLQPVFRAEPSAQDNSLIRLRVVSDDNLALQLGLVTVNYTLSAAEPSLFIGSPGYIETGVGLDKNITEKLTVSNKGLAGLHNIQLTLTEVDGTTPAPNWLYLSSGTSLGDLNVGESETINITFNPSSAIAEADYEYRLKISSDELGDRLVAVYVAVTQSGKGNAFFHTSDIYTATLDDFGSPIPGLAGAKIKLQNEQVLTQQYEVTADANGEALFADIPAGRYIFRASAPDHQDVSGRIVIKPGITVVEEVFLMNQIITVEFSVNEITIQDKYEIILKAIYETSVPVAVVIAEPQSINLPVMKKGETLLGEIRLTNYGLIRAYDLRSVFPQSNELIKFELLYPVPESIDAGEVITLPYRITALSDFDPEAQGAATGGGCGNFQFLHCLPNTCVCANGAIVHNQTCTVFYANWGSCSSGSSTGAGGITQSYGGGFVGGGGGTTILSKPQAVTETEPECLASGGATADNGDADKPDMCN